MKKVLKWVGIAILTPILLFILLTILIYLPPVQNWAVKRVAAYASEETGMNITVERVKLVFPLDLGIDGVLATEPNDSLKNVTDTVLDARSIVVDVRLLPLFSGNVEIDALELNSIKLNTKEKVPDLRIRGSMERLYAASHGIDLGAETVRLDEAEITGALVDVALGDSVPPDTTESETRWKINVEDLRVVRSDVTVHMPGDSMQVQAYMDKAQATGGRFDLLKGEYVVGKFDWNDGRLNYDLNYEKSVDGLDVNHIALTNVNVGIDSLYYCDPELRLNIRQLAFKEKSGIEVSELTGPVRLDSAKIYLPAMRLRTPNSYLDADFVMDMNTFDDKNPGEMHLKADGQIGKQDIMLFLGDLPEKFKREYPNQPMTVKAVMAGNMKHVDITGLYASLPTAFTIKANGVAANVDNMDKLLANVDVEARTENMNFVTALVPMDGVRIPHGIGMKGNVRVNGSSYRTDLVATEGGGSVKINGGIDIKSMRYDAVVKANNLQLQHFLPGMGLGPFTGEANVKGAGTDIMSPRTQLDATATIHKFNYGNYNLDGITAKATMHNGVIRSNIDANNPLLKGLINLSAQTNSKLMHATVTADLKHADLYNLKLAEQPLIVALCGHVDMTTDMNEYYDVQGTLDNVMLQDSLNAYYPETLDFDILTSRDTTHAVVNCGDFYLNADAQGGYKWLMAVGDRMSKQLNSDLEARRIDQASLRKLLPVARVSLSAGSNNFVSTVLARFGIVFEDARMDMTSSPEEGINGDLEVNKLIADGVHLDKIQFFVESSDVNMTFRGQVQNFESNPQYTFNALFDGYLLEHGAGVNVKLYDDKDRLGVKLGAEAIMETEGIRLRLLSDETILGYKKFSVNDDNYIFLSEDKRLSARLAVRAEDGQAVSLYTNDDNVEALQDITLNMTKFDLQQVLSVVPYAPSVSGIMNGDFHLIQTKENTSVASSLSVDKMTYEHNYMGDMATDFVYIPKGDGTHFVDGVLYRNGKDIGDLTGSYNPEGEGYLDATLTLNRTPLSLANGFVPDQIIGLRGYAEGALDVKGSLTKPQVNGELFLDSCYIFSEPYGVEMRFSNDPVRIIGSNLMLENFELYGHNENPLNISGNINFSNLDDVYMKARMVARNYQIINAKETKRSIAYGKAFVNFFGMMEGPMSKLKMRGKLDVLGSTDMSYVLRDSPLTTDNHLDELVDFKDFSDTTLVATERPPLSGFDMDLTLAIEEGAHIMAYLNEDHSNYVDLMGGGNLRMKYNNVDNVQIIGKYNLSNGEMKYSLPIIPLKTFTIKDGSYIEFNGDPMNPRLNIAATERVKATVSNSGGQGRAVDFECGVNITKTLSDMGLEFTLDAPEDQAIHNELQTMGTEQRGKLAVTMLTTGMYLADGNTNGFSMNSALSSFLQNEINNITGNALRTLDVSFGVDNATDAKGNMHTDYSFKFAKRFWNNRVKVTVGGKVSTGANIPQGNRSFFDNVSLEYRLDNTANKYVTVFYNNNVYDWLDGYTQQYGGSFIWRRSLQTLGDIFNFKSDKPKLPTPTAPRDTTLIRKEADNEKK